MVFEDLSGMGSGAICFTCPLSVGLERCKAGLDRVLRNDHAESRKFCFLHEGKRPEVM